MTSMASQITSLAIFCSTVYSGADQRKHQSSASLAFVRGIHRGPVNSPHKWPVTRKMFPFDDVIMHALGRGDAYIRRETMQTLVEILWFRPHEIYLNEIIFEIQIFPYTKMSSAICWPFCVGLNVLTPHTFINLFIFVTILIVSSYSFYGIITWISNYMCLLHVIIYLLPMHWIWQFIHIYHRNIYRDKRH